MLVRQKANLHPLPFYTIEFTSPGEVVTFDCAEGAPPSSGLEHRSDMTGTFPFSTGAHL